MSFQKKLALIILASFIIIPVVMVMYIYVQFNYHLKFQYPSKSFIVQLPLYSVTDKSFSSKATCLDNEIDFTVSKVSTSIYDNYQKQLTAVTLEKELEKYLHECNITLFNITSVTSIKDYAVDESPAENLKLLPNNVTISLTKESTIDEVSNNLYLFYNKILNPNNINMESLKLHGNINGSVKDVILTNSYSSLSLDDIKSSISKQIK